MESTVGLRERKKAATREAVHRAALRLTVEHGLDQVTVEAVADAAGISRRTFSNYFATKEDAVLWGEERQIKALVQALRDRPAGEPPWTALHRALLELFPDSATDRETALRTRLALRHPSLLARMLGNHAALEADLTAAIAERDPSPTPETPLQSRVLATAFLSSLRIAMHLWVESDLSREPRELIGEIMDRMARPFT